MNSKLCRGLSLPSRSLLLRAALRGYDGGFGAVVVWGRRSCILGACMHIPLLAISACMCVHACGLSLGEARAPGHAIRGRERGVLWRAPVELAARVALVASGEGCEVADE